MITAHTYYTMPAVYKKSGEQFFHERNTEFHKSREVNDTVDYLRQNGNRIANNPAQKLGAYIDFLAGKQVNDGLLTGDEESIDRQIKQLIIQPNDVPASYFELQARIARDRGMGDLEIDPQQRLLMIESIQEDQEQSLRKWARYLTDTSNNVPYPDWFKKYAFEGMLKLGKFDKNDGEFTKRSKHTVAPYADLNAEALSYVYDMIDTAIVGEGKPEAEPEHEPADALVQIGNFGKLYAYALNVAANSNYEQLKITSGSWKKYTRIEGEYDPYYDVQDDGEYVDDTPIEDETVLALAGSLQGHGTGWCTAGTRTAANQLSQGDFYVYYSQDAEGKDTIPRIAIRMEDDWVAEVRGIEHDQELESSMIDIVDEKLAELPGGDEYALAVADVKRMTMLDRATQDGLELSPDDLQWLWFNEPAGFGHDPVDPRLYEIREHRDRAADLAAITERFGQKATFDYALDQEARQRAVVRNGRFIAQFIDLFDELSSEEKTPLRNVLMENLGQYHSGTEKEMLSDSKSLLALGVSVDEVLLNSINNLSIAYCRELDPALAELDEEWLRSSGILSTNQRRAIEYFESLKDKPEDDRERRLASRAINVLGHIHNVVYELPALRKAGFIAEPNFLAQRLGRADGGFEGYGYVRDLFDAGADREILMNVHARKPWTVLGNIKDLTAAGYHFDQIDSIIEEVLSSSPFMFETVANKFSALIEAGANEELLLASLARHAPFDEDEVSTLLQAGLAPEWIAGHRERKVE